MPNAAYPSEQVCSDWWKESYNAEKGCITVFIVRGKLCQETDEERKTYETDPPEHFR